MNKTSRRWDWGHRNQHTGLACLLAEVAPGFSLVPGLIVVADFYCSPGLLTDSASLPQALLSPGSCSVTVSEPFTNSSGPLQGAVAMWGIESGGEHSFLNNNHNIKLLLPFEQSSPASLQ